MNIIQRFGAFLIGNAVMAKQNEAVITKALKAHTERQAEMPLESFTTVAQRSQYFAQQLRKPANVAQIQTSLLIAKVGDQRAGELVKLATEVDKGSLGWMAKRSQVHKLAKEAGLMKADTNLVTELAVQLIP